MKYRLHAALGLAAALLYVCSLVGAAQPLIILDPGHDPVYPGALGTCGESEYVYNDRIVAAYERPAHRPGVCVIPCRQSRRTLPRIR